jgi:hypothetical protein
VRRAAAAALAAALLAGCGGDDGPPRLAKAEYERRGTVICSDYRAALKKLGTPTQVSQFGDYIGRALPLLDRAVARLGRLRPPQERDEAFQSYLTGLRATRRRAVDLRSAAGKADAATVERLLEQAADTRGLIDGQARKAGLAACVGA